MHTTAKYLDDIRVQLKLPSDYALAKHWHVTPQRVSEYRRGVKTLGEDRCIEVAEILGIPPEQVILEIQAERARKSGHDKVSAILERVLRRLAHAPALVAMLAVFMALASMPKDSYANDARISPICERLNSAAGYLALCQLVKALFIYYFRTIARRDFELCQPLPL